MPLKQAFPVLANSVRMCAGIKALAVMLGALALICMPIALMCVTVWAVPVIASIACIVLVAWWLLLPKPKDYQLLFIALGLAVLATVSTILISQQAIQGHSSTFCFNVVALVLSMLFSIVVGMFAFAIGGMAVMVWTLFRHLQNKFMPACETEMRHSREGNGLDEDPAQ